MIVIRPAVEEDAPALGRMGAGMVGFHHAFDDRRFILPENVREGYAWWLTKELSNPQAVVLVAERHVGDMAQIVGYLYATIEGTDWALLLGPHAGLHDVWVEESARGSGTGKLLLEAALVRFRELGARQVVLMTATQNQPAQKFFARFGFRQTMIEMTREIGEIES